MYRVYTGYINSFHLGPSLSPKVRVATTKRPSTKHYALATNPESWAFTLRVVTG